MSRSIIAGSFVGMSVIAAGILTAGPLDPPTGEISSSFKTIFEVEPRTPLNSTTTPGDSDSVLKITTSGSYYLTGNVLVPAGKHGIEVATRNVTIDLNGFTVSGVNGSLDGVQIGPFDRVKVRNGTLQNLSGRGVNAAVDNVDNLSSEGSRFEDLSVSGCDAGGISTGAQAVVSDCVIEFCGDVGLLVGFSSVVDRCVVRANTLDGIRFSSACVITRTTSRLNGGDGMAAATPGTVSVLVEGCAVFANSGDGIEVGTGSVVRGNQIMSAGLSGGDGAGIHVVGGDNRIDGNNVSISDRGIDVDVAGNIIIGNTCTGNTVNYSIAVGNSFGPIIAAGTNAAAVNGSSASGTLGSSDAWANFSY